MASLLSIFGIGIDRGGLLINGMLSWLVPGVRKKILIPCVGVPEAAFSIAEPDSDEFDIYRQFLPRLVRHATLRWQHDF